MSASGRGIRNWLFRVLILVMVAALVGVLALAASKGMRVYRDVTAIKHRLDKVESIAEGDGQAKRAGSAKEMLQVLRQELEGGQQDFRALKEDVAPFLPLAAKLGWVPRFGSSIEAVPHLVAMGDYLLAAAGTALEAVDPLLDVAFGDKPASGEDRGSITERLLAPLIEAQPRLVDAQALIEQAVAERAAIDTTRLHPLLTKQLDRLDKYLPALRAATQAATVAPDLLGAVRPRTYLLLAENNDEIRPTGGFITAIGLLTVDRGKITRLDFRDGYQVDNWERDHPPAPEPLLRYMDAQLWVFRDSNFWPDFATSAKAAEYFAELDLSLQVDGVIAADQFALQILVGGLGGVVVPEYDNDLVTAENAIQKMREYWAPPDAHIRTKGWWRERKEFMNVLMDAMRKKLEEDAGSINLTRFGKAVLQTLNEKHVLVYLRDPYGGGFARESNWDGAVTATTSDYLFVVDTNMGFNKANAIVERRIDYQVRIDAAGLAQGRVTVEYRNPTTRTVECIHEPIYEGSYDLMIQRCYWNYLRIYTPEGTTAIANVEGGDMELLGVETGKQVFATWQVLAPQETQQIVLGYYLPNSVVTKAKNGLEYRLVVQKQAGTWAHPLRVTVSPPPGTSVVAASPAPKAIDGNVVVFEAKLNTDQEFRVVFR